MNIAIFASGSGTNAENIIRRFNTAPDTDKTPHVSVVICNKPTAGVIARAQALNVPVELISPSDLKDEAFMQLLLDKYNVEFVVLAGFLLMIPDFMLERYKDRIVNIHPSLLPKYGGKGMYGNHIHEAVVAAGETETGITIHTVTDRCDEGAPLFQARVAVEPTDTPEMVASKVHALEYEHYPEVIANLVRSLQN